MANFIQRQVNINKDKHKYAIYNSSKSTNIMNQSKDIFEEIKKLIN